MLTELSISKLTPAAKPKEWPDGRNGLFLLVHPTGRKVWTVRYRARDGRPRKLTLGPYPAVSLKEARRRALEAVGAVAGGADPAAAKQEYRATAKAEREAQIDTVESVAERFIERHAKRRTRDWKATERLLRTVVARWKGRRLSQITRAHVRDMIEGMVDRTPVRANRTLSAFRKLCNWAIENDLIEHNPCDKVAAQGVETSRDRVLDDDEIRRVWMSSEKLGYPFCPIVQLLMLTGQRRQEVAGLKWSELDLAAHVWRLAPSRTKNKRAHEVPLSDVAVKIIEALPRIEGNGDFVFSAVGRPSSSTFAKAKTKIDAEVKPLTPWVVHDLRRTVATAMQKLGVKLEVTENVLNHASGSRAGVTGIYARYGFEAEKRAALDAWARRLEAIVTGAAAANVVELAKARG
jgi:integrase